MLDAEVPYEGSLCIPGPARPTLWWAFMPGMAPRYPEGSVGVWASLKPRDGGLISWPAGVPTSRRQTGFPSILLYVTDVGPPCPRNGYFGIQADGRLCVLGVGNSSGERCCIPLETSPGLGRACSCLKKGQAQVLGWQFCSWEIGACEAHRSLRGLGLGTDVHLAS